MLKFDTLAVVALVTGNWTFDEGRFLVRQTVSAPEFAHYPTDWHFSPALDTGDFVFFSGQTGCRPDNSVSLRLRSSFAMRSSF